MHIGIAGAGLLGRLLAWRLAGAGHQVEVFDPAQNETVQMSQAAATAAAGMLSPTAELECANEEVFELGLRSIALWQTWLQSEPESGFAQTGSLLVAHRSDLGAAERVVSLLTEKTSAPYAPQALALTRLQEMESAIRGVAHAWLLPHEAYLNPVATLGVLTHKATQLGVRWHWNQRVLELTPQKLHVDSASHAFDVVIDVRGVGAKGAMPVRGVRGEIFCLQTKKPLIDRPIRLLHPRHRVYLVPRAPDCLMVGASEIESEDDSPVSVRTTLELLSAAHSVLPELSEARILWSRTHLRPALPDNLPQLEMQTGLVRINGLFRHGWLIAPALVEKVLNIYESTYA